MPAESTLGMSINRTFELIDESKGVDQEGHYILTTRIDDGVFLKGRLYRVTLKAGIPLSDEDKDWYSLALEDSYPAGWRSLNSNFQTENALTRSTSTDGWSHIESRDDRMLAYVDI